MGPVGTCRVHPQFREVETPPEWAWRILFRSYRDIKDLNEEKEQYVRRVERVVGDYLRRHLIRGLKGLEHVGREEVRDGAEGD